LTSEVATAGAVAGPGVAPFDLLPHNCFACGTLNTHGLRLLLHVEPRRCWTELALDERFEGWVGMAHGGIVCTILDEVMAWSLVGEDNWGVTARLAVEFKRPVAIGTAVRAVGEIASSRRRIVETMATLVDVADGTILATATGTYLAAGSARKQALRDRYGFRSPDTASIDTRDAGAEAPR
jgi:acyl-coenzyme A thioesterase PaaI-like protein